MSQSAFDSLLQKYLAGQCTAEEEKAVLEWYEALIRDSDLDLSAEERTRIEARIWASLQQGKVIAGEGEDSKRANPEERVMAIAGRKVIALRWRRVGIAAAVILLIGIGIWYVRPANTIVRQMADVPEPDAVITETNGTSGVSTIILPDSSHVLLQPHAALSYLRQFRDGKREVRLSGSAFFEVRPNPSQHFLVHAGDKLTTEVLGTSFHILQGEAPDKIEVQVVTGKVCVYASKPIILTRNKKVIFNETTNECIMGLVDAPQPLYRDEPRDSALPSLSPGRMAFEDVPLDSVAKAIHDLYGLDVQVATPELGRYHFTGDISKYDLYKQLDIISRSTQSVYEIKGSQIVIRPR